MAENPIQNDSLEVDEVEDGFVVFHPEKNTVHFLNATAVVILELCDGRHSREEIAILVKELYKMDEAPQDQVDETLESLAKEELIRFS